MSLKSRLQKLEVKARGDMPPMVADWIGKGLYFDDLTPEQQAIYCRYRWNAEEPPAKWFGKFPGYEYNEHFQLDRKPPPPTQAEIEASIREVQEYMNKKQEEYAREKEQSERKEP